MKKRLYSRAIILIALLMISCATTGPGGKRDLIFMSTAQEVDLGKEFDKKIRGDAKILNDSGWQSYFDEIGQKIVGVSDRKNLSYHFTVIESDDINAFATPGGYVYIYTGLLRIMDNEAQLAAVTAHEISHVVARHSVKQLQQVLGIAVLEQIVLGKSDSKTLESAINIGLSVALSGYSRSNEKEADKYGVYYMEKAGFNPSGALELFAHLQEASGEGKRSFFENMLASHPETALRIANVKEQLAPYPPEIMARDKGEKHYRQFRDRLPKPVEQKPAK